VIASVALSMMADAGMRPLAPSVRAH